MADFTPHVTEEDNALSVDLAIEVCEKFGIDKKDAVELAKGVLVTVCDNWRIIAEKNGLSKSSIEYMKPAFGATQI